MRVKAEALTLIPALLFFGLAAYLSFLSTQIENDQGLKQLLNVYFLIVFHIGVFLTIIWLVYWLLYRKIAEKE